MSQVFEGSIANLSEGIEQAKLKINLFRNVIPDTAEKGALS